VEIIRGEVKAHTNTKPKCKLVKHGAARYAMFSWVRPYRSALRKII